MAALAYNLGKREINHYFSVRSAKVLALVAVLLLAACHLASRRYRGERALPLPGPAGGGGDAAAGGRPPRPTHAHAHAFARPPASPRAGPAGRRCPHVPPGAPGCGPGAPGRLSGPQCGPPPEKGPWSWGPRTASAAVRAADPGLARAAFGVRAPARPGPGEPHQARASRAPGPTLGPRGPTGDAEGGGPPARGTFARVGVVDSEPRGPALWLLFNPASALDCRAEVLLDSGKGRPIFLCRPGDSWQKMPLAKWRRYHSACVIQKRLKGLVAHFLQRKGAGADRKEVTG